MESNGSDRIEAASSIHLDQIEAIATEYRLDRLSEEQLGNTGFFVSNFTKDDYLDFLERADQFFVSISGEVINGFLLAYSKDRIKPNEWLNWRLKNAYEGEFVLIKQVCVRPDSTSRGVGTRLYQHIFNHSADKTFFAAIATRPCNQRSIRFHEKLGFRLVAKAIPPDGIERGVWGKRLSCRVGTIRP